MPTTGSQIGSWLLQRVLGEGGNSVVWSGQSGMGSAAVKVLKLPQGTERYDRFAQEVRVHLEVLRDCPGVLPLLEAEVPTADVIETAPWLAMPIAQPLASHLGRNRQPRVVIDHIISIGSTLAFLLEQHGVSHRDIKPENLYWVDGRAAVGDFGLVEVPGGRGLSRDDRDLGPRDLLAPEMRAGSTSRQGPPADVFSLGMTAFLLIAGTAPRDGLRRDERTHHLAELLNDHSLRELDRILQRATAYRSEERLSMATLVRELEAWASPPQRQKGVLDTSGVQLRIEALRASPLTDARGGAQTRSRRNPGSARSQRQANLCRLEPTGVGGNDIRCPAIRAL